MIAEESTSFPGVTRPVFDGGLGFDFKWNMGWMHDTLQYFKTDPLFRKYHHDKLTFGMLYQWSESFVQAFSHDEVVHGKGSLIRKMPAPTVAEQFANLRCLLALQWTWPGKKTLFMGCEFGQFAEWNHERSLDWHLLDYPLHSGVQHLVRDLNRLYVSDASLAAREGEHDGFSWINPADADQSVLTFARWGEQCHWVVIANFTPVDRTYRFGVPHGGQWEEVLNTDADCYGGKGRGNWGAVQAQALPCHQRPYSIEVFLPGLSVLVFRQKTGVLS